jgi:hypothetical protein
MTAPALGIAYSIWLRARWSALGIAIYLLGLSIAAQVYAGIREPVLLAALLLTTAITHLIQVFTLGPADIGVRASGYPKHMFVLPLATRSLVGWPMLIAAATHAGLWILVATLVFIPAGFAAPRLWPAALFAASTAWVQAIGWTPFPTPYLRVPALALAMTPLFGLGAWAGMFLEQSAVSSVVTAGSVVWGLFAYVFAVRGLSRARRGDDGNLGVVVDRLLTAIAGQVRMGANRARRPFRSAVAAQLWHEWRRNASCLPVMLGLIGLPMLALNCRAIFNPESHRTLLFGSVAVSTSAMCLLLWVGLLLLLAATIGASVGKFDLWGKEAMPSFFAIRPMTTSQFIWIKLLAVVMSAFASTAILVLLVAVWTAVEVSPLNPSQSLVRAAFGELTSEKAALAGAAVFGLTALTWRGIAIGMWPSLTGRKWISVAIGVFFTGMMTLAIIAGSWIYRHPEVRSDCLSALPWLLGMMVAAKCCAAAGTVHMLTRHRLMESRDLALVLAGWSAIVGVILAGALYFGPLSWLLVAGAMLLVPFTRLAIGPAALHWNRHR